MLFVEADPVRLVVELDDLEHLVAAVAYAVAILGADVAWGEVGGDDGCQLVGIAVFEQVDERSADCAVDLHFGWFAPDVLNCQQRVFAQLVCCFGIGHEAGYLLGINDSQAE